LAEYIANDSQRYAELTVEKLFYSVDVLELYPKAGKKVPEFNDNSLRQLIVGSYRIIYLLVDVQRIDILTVHNCARLLSNIGQSRK
jgi:plasmid stabilization system protein ParE